MRGRTLLKVSLCVAIFTGMYSSITSSVFAFSIMEFLGVGTDEKQEENRTVAKTPSAPAVKETKSPKNTGSNPSGIYRAELEFSDLKKTLAVLDDDQRKQVLDDKKLFGDFVAQEAGNASVLAAAKANRVHESKNTRILAQRSVDNVVRELYLSQLLASKIPADYPLDEQVQEYYNRNKEEFVIDERMHVWQIFLPISEGAGKKDIELLKKRAESISNDLKRNKVDFAGAANKHSKHEASRLSGGYMGLIKVSELKSEVKNVIKTLRQGDISLPVVTNDGIHILKRGITVPRQDVALERIKPKIIELMLQQINAKIRQAVLKQIAVTYPIDLKDKKIEEWRLKLRAN